MDPLSWFLLVWIVVSAVVFFFVQNVLPIFIPPLENIEQKTQKPSPHREHMENVVVQSSFKNISQESQQPLAALSTWAASTFGPTPHLGESCDWANDLLIWMYRHVKYSPDLANAWLKAMNDASSKTASTLGCDVYFEEVLPSTDDTVSAPRLNSIRSEFGPREHLTMRANMVYPKLSVRLVASQKLPDRLLVSNYLATLRDITGQAHVRIACIGDDLFFMICFEGKPEVVITFENSDKIAAEHVDETVVDEMVKRCLASAVTNVNLAKLQEQPMVNKAMVNGGGGGVLVSAADIKQCQAVTMQDRQRSNRLLLKVERAEKLGGGKLPSQPYVVVELDEPPQKHTTTLGFKENPAWEEQFLFELNERSEEILFEVYDRQTLPLGSAPIADEDEPRFLGLAIVGVEELRQSANLMHTLALQGRPYKEDMVSGTLTVEFVFLREQLFAETQSGKRIKRDSMDAQSRPLHVVTDFKPTVGGMKTAMDSPYIDGAAEEHPPMERRLGPPPKIRDQTPLTSDSEMSVTSSDSVYPQSQLVVETREEGVMKYYLVPPTVQRHAIGKRLMKSGKKLHIYNEHTFTAVKTRTGSTCAVCGAVIATAFRRKGYQCRDCGFVCHKRCHFKTEGRCPFSKVSTLPIEIVKIT